MIHLSLLPHNYHLSPRYFTTTNDSDHDFPWWQWWLPFITLQQQTQRQFPLHHFMNYDNPISSQIPFHHLMTYNDLSPSPHDSPIPFPSLLPWRISMSMQQEDIFTGEQVCAMVTWWHVSPKHPSWLMWPQLTPVILQQWANHHRTICINW